MLSESASIILSSVSTIGSPQVNADYTNFVFRNFDLKSAIGEMWDKYDKFCLKPVQISNMGTVTQPGGSSFIVVTYNMKGLDWININYETNANSQAWAPIFQKILGATSGNNDNNSYTNNGWSYNFRKSRQIVDLEITLTVTDATSIIPPTGQTYNNVQFHFVIEPVITGKMNECAFFGFNSNPALTPIVGRQVDSTKKIYTYSSFDMRRLCSEFWGHHKDYEILMGWQLIRGSGAITNDARIMPIQMTGLNFKNSLLKNGNNTTNPILNYSTEKVIIGTVIQPSTGSSHYADTQYSPAPVEFEKTSDNVNLTIQFNNYDNTTLASGTYSALQPFYQLGFFIRPNYGFNKATLQINPWGLTTSVTNLGVRDANYTTFTLNNIDMRMVCQNMWQKYNKFNIFLTDVAVTVATGSANNAAVLLQMEGFDFINQTSWITNSAQTQVATLGAIFNTASNSEPKAIGNQASFCTTFYKTKDLVDLKLTALPLAPNTPFNVVQPLASNFTFTIVGVEE